MLRALMLIVFTALCITAAALWHGWQSLMPDVSFYVVYADRVLDGATPYVDILETNPPLALWLTLPSAWAARLLHADSHHTFVVFIALLTALVVWLCYRLSRAARDGWELTAVQTVTLVLVLTLLPQKAYGEREHMLVMFLAPYLVLAAQRLRGEAPSGRGLTFVAGVLAGLGVCFKPFFLAIPALTELVLLIGRRGWGTLWRAEVAGLALPIVTFPGLVLWLTPAYVSNIMPLALATYFGFAPVPVMAAVLKPLALLTLAAAAAALLIWRSNDVRLPDAVVWMAAATGAYIAYLVQQKGFLYHVYPAFAFAVMAAAAASVGHRLRLSRFAVWAFVLMVAGLLCHKLFSDNRAARADLQAVMQGDRPLSLMVLTADMGLPFPYLEDNHVVWASSFQSLWMLPAATDGFLAPEDKDKVIAATAALVTRDLEIYAPAYVLVDRNDVRNPVNTEIPFIALFSANPGFRAAWSHYGLVRSANKKELWKRNS